MWTLIGKQGSFIWKRILEMKNSLQLGVQSTVITLWINCTIKIVSLLLMFHIIDQIHSIITNAINHESVDRQKKGL